MASKPPGIVPIPDWKNEAIKEKGFGAIILSSLGTVGSKVDVALFALMLVSGTVGVVVARIEFDQLALPWLTATIVQQWANFAATFAATILGFLISGFSVFATVTRPSVFHLLAQFRQQDRKISEFKFVFYNFLYIFAHYIVYLSICMVAVFAFTRESPVWFAGHFIWQHTPILVDILTATLGVLIVSYSILSLLLLRSFLWNLYQGLLFAIFVEERPQTSSAKPSSTNLDG